MGCIIRVLFEPKMMRISKKNGLEMAILPLRGWVIPLGTIWDNGVTFGVHLYPKCQELVKE